MFFKHKFFEHAFQHCLVRLLVKLEFARLVDEGHELHRLALAQLFNRGVHLRVPDALIFFLLGARVQPLPGQVSAQELHEHLA